MDFPKSVPNIGLIGGRFADENTSTGQPGSLIPAQWGNAVTLEILNALTAAGIVPDEFKTNQLAEAIGKQALGFKPVQQGGGVGQTDPEANKIFIGWSLAGRLCATVDNTNLGDFAFKSNLQAIVNQIVASPPANLNTIQKLAFAVGNDPAYAQTVNGNLAVKADKATTLAGYGITDGATKASVATKADAATTLAGYNIPIATQSEAEAGTDNSKPLTSLRVAQYVSKVLQGFQAALGFSPVQQGGGIGQTGTTQNKVFIGFGTNSRLKVTVDNTDLGNVIFDTNTAQEAAPGIIRLSTLEAVQLGTETLTAVTPKNLRLGFFVSISFNGYIVFPTWLGSLMIQWGRYSLAAPTGTQIAVSYPIPFGTVLHAWAGVDGGATDQIGTAGLTKTGMTVSKGSADTSARTGSWFAIGGAF
ncbi:hypothetical protein YA0871_15190 [Pseudomonas paralactis]|uniref:Putative tail fiber protein gp53-like C-terminal domain-containing protein n=1 Tax=Pseudomonas paralactis TaxID=1615673 RepID=A0ABS0V139_9PSED|nr:hypothetical protein [Pseudomonas paralactis]MBI6634009.1 hypothetical protein [Pseudomonas paralactis]